MTMTGAISNVIWKGGNTLSYETCSCMFLLLSNQLCVNIKDILIVHFMTSFHMHNSCTPELFVQLLPYCLFT